MEYTDNGFGFANIRIILGILKNRPLYIRK
jgi:hypothetical protein